eukprot:gene17449-20774_t
MARESGSIVAQDETGAGSCPGLQVADLRLPVTQAGDGLQGRAWEGGLRVKPRRGLRKLAANNRGREKVKVLGVGVAAGGGDRSGSGSRPGTAPRNPEEVIMEYTAGYAPGIKAKALAISVDGEGGPGQRSQRYRLFAAYRDTGMVAASFDPGGGGFVNWPSGHLCFVYTAETGSGTVYDNTGNPTTTWSDANGDPLSESVEVLLDSHMGFRFKVPEKRVEMYFACHNVRHRFVNCFNRAKASS